MLPTILELALLAPALVIAITFHEYAHGQAAYWLGDPTAKEAGRLSLNPLRHLDPLGTIMLFIARIGWGKPVPINPANFRHPRRDMMYSSLAGPLSNFLLAAVIGVILPVVAPDTGLIRLELLAIGELSLILGIFNMLPVPPLDGSRILLAILPKKALPLYFQFERYGILILVLAIAVFRLPLGTVIMPPLTFFRHWLLRV